MAVDPHPRMRRLYNIGALRRRWSRPGKVVSEVDTPVRMHSSMTAQMRMSYGIVRQL
jgi:hypothetical protein